MTMGRPEHAGEKNLHAFFHVAPTGTFLRNTECEFSFWGVELSHTA